MKILDSIASGVRAPEVGARVDSNGVSYRVWAPDQKEISVVIGESDPFDREFALISEDNGYWAGTDPSGRAGDLYRFRFADGRLRPDPTSRLQSQGVHGPSACVDSSAFQWRCSSWSRPAWKGQSIYEIHVGTFTSAGTYFSVIEKLNYIRELGVDAIELMPLADFAGDRNWGYDGVSLYAPARCYGHPDDLRALVDAAHEKGLAVILDVVYNHLGPAGNYLADFSANYFRQGPHTPWGQGFNLDGSLSRPVRDFIVGNATYWLDEFRFDGLRLDATHAIPDQSSRHLIAEITAAVHARNGFVIAEDERNEAGLLAAPEGGGLGLDALWADDFHHQVRVALTQTRDSYFRAYNGTAADLADVMANGWTYRGQAYEPWKGKARGSASEQAPPASFVYCIENHDQVGNRANGERLEHLVSSAQFRAASMLLCLSPYAPMLFMGQEWAASTPFLYFTDHKGELGAQISKGRKKEFEQHGTQWTEGNFPDPESPETFHKSKLRWEERTEKEHAVVRNLYQICLEHRRQLLGGEGLQRGQWEVASFGDFVAVRYHVNNRDRLLVASLRKAKFPSTTPAPILQPPAGMAWRKTLASEDPLFGGPLKKAVNSPVWKFDGPGAIWLESIKEETIHARH